MKHSAAFLSLLPTLAFAHDGHSAVGFLQGVSHPLGGADHVLAMLAVGLWAGSQTTDIKRAALAPASFVLWMLVGAALGVAGVAVPTVELMIAASLVVLGAALALQWRWSLPAMAALVSAFAVFHGYAHGLESGVSGASLSFDQSLRHAAPFMVGMALSTGLLHALGILTLRAWSSQRLALRLAGTSIAAYGAYLLAI
jgi:urease accessory protein